MGKQNASSPAPLCFLCARYRDSYRCEAFPDGIPFEVIASHTDHRRPIDGDHGLQYVPVTPVARQYADELFSPSEKDAPRVRLRRLRRRPAAI